MALYYQRKQEIKQEVIDTYYDLMKYTSHISHSNLFFSTAEKYRDKETKAAIDIQKNWRMLKVKWHYQLIQRSCRLIQRIFRGYAKGRKLLFRRIEEQHRKMQMDFFNEEAKII